MVKRLKRLGPQMRPTLDSFDFWTAVAYFFLVAVVIVLFFVNQSTQSTITKQARDEATHAAEIVAIADARYQACTASIPQLKKIDSFIEGNQDGWHILITNSTTNRDIAPKGTPVWKQRNANLQRIVRASRKIDQASVFPVPTLQQCRALRKQLLSQT